MPNFTKQAIKASFLQLLNEHPLREISAKMIVENCGINRKSFYYHYQDIPSLLAEIIKERIDAALDACRGFHSIEDCLNLILKNLLQKKNIVRHIYDSVSRDAFEEGQMHICDYIVRAYLAELTDGYQIGEQDMQWLIQFYRSECFGIIMDWMMRGMPEDIFNFLHRMCTMRSGLSEEFVKRLSEHPM